MPAWVGREAELNSSHVRIGVAVNARDRSYRGFNGCFHERRAGCDDRGDRVCPRESRDRPDLSFCVDSHPLVVDSDRACHDRVHRGVIRVHAEDSRAAACRPNEALRVCCDPMRETRDVRIGPALRVGTAWIVTRDRIAADPNALFEVDRETVGPSELSRYALLRASVACSAVAALHTARFIHANVRIDTGDRVSGPSRDPEVSVAIERQSVGVHRGGGCEQNFARHRVEFGDRD